MGCMLCVNICPVNCIKIKYDTEGFAVPYVEKEKCIECSKCINMCVSKVPAYYPKTAYAVQSTEWKYLKDSASGGIAFEICKKTIQNGGVAYGAVYDKNFYVYHERATTIEQLKRQQGSKYVQSDISLIYKSVENDSKKGIPVTVVGTPCQIASLKKYLKYEYPNLLLIDLICHGVPSPNIFVKYLEWKRNKIKANRVIDYKFRDKKSGWGTNFKVVFDKKEIYGAALEEPYYADFIFAYSYRESCYKCQYARQERVGDITIGDYWGISDYHPEIDFDITKGVSCVLVNTDKGEKEISALSTTMKIFPSAVENVIACNSNLRQPANRPEIRNEYYGHIDENGFDWSKKKIIKSAYFYKSWIKRHIPQKIKGYLKVIYRRLKK